MPVYQTLLSRGVQRTFSGLDATAKIRPSTTVGLKHLVLRTLLRLALAALIALPNPTAPNALLLLLARKRVRRTATHHARRAATRSADDVAFGLFAQITGHAEAIVTARGLLEAGAALGDALAFLVLLRSQAFAAATVGRDAEADGFVLGFAVISCGEH